MMKLKNSIYYIKFTLAYLIGSIFLAVIVSWIQNNDTTLATVLQLFIIIFFTAYLSGIFGSLFFKYFSSKSQKEITQRILPAILIFWIGVIVITAFVINISWWLWNRETDVYESYIINLYDFWYAFKYLVPWIIIGSIAFFYSLWRKGVNREQKLNEELLRFKYQNLKNQINPHFLFNSLNTLSSLITSNPEKADRFTHTLSDVYRYILINENNLWVSLAEELDFVNQYFELQKIRDEGKIFLDFQIESPEKYEIIPISLQVLIENALKHNSATKQNPLRISILKTELYLEVVNNLQRKTNMDNSSKTGLINLSERVRLIMNRELIVEERSNEFSVKIPIKEKQV